jgi:hypothetical protein
MKSLISKSHCGLIVLFLSVALHAPAQVVLLKADGNTGLPLRITRYGNPWIQRETSVFRTQLTTEFQKVDLPTARGSHEVWMINLPEESAQVYLGAGDTLYMQYTEVSGWHFESGNAAAFNGRISAIDRLCDSVLMQAAANKSQPVVKQVRQFADTILNTSARFGGEFEQGYLKFRVALTEISSESRSRKALIQRYFNSIPQPLNPAWMESFHQLFGSVLQQELIRDRSDTLKTAISNAQVDSIQHYFARRFPDWSSEIRDLALVLGLYREGYRKGISRGVILRNLERLLAGKSPNIQQFVEDIQDDWLRYQKGAQMPPFTYTSQGKTLNSETLLSKPLYLAYYPDLDLEVQRELLMLKALYAKYKSGISFLVVVNTTNEAYLNKVITETQPGFDVVSAARCSETFFQYPEREDTRTYLLLEAGGSVFQAPAEGPETGVDAAFLGLMKKR